MYNKNICFKHTHKTNKQKHTQKTTLNKHNTNTHTTNNQHNPFYYTKHRP
jgi:hypothetical protein